MTNLQNEIEIWKDIPGYENIYKASTLGRIKSLDRTLYKKNNCGYHYTARKGIILKPFRQRDGYLLICLQDKYLLVHRVIYRTFKGEIPKGWYAVMHLNNIKNDNRLINLRLGTYSENAIQAIKDKLYVHGRIGKHGKNNPQSKPVRQLDLNGNFIARFESAVEAAKKFNINQGAISSACTGYSKTSCGYKWEYAINNKIKKV